jgi:hypothetical protein
MRGSMRFDFRSWPVCSEHADRVKVITNVSPGGEPQRSPLVS